MRNESMQNKPRAAAASLALPMDAAMPALLAALAAHPNVLLAAPPGSGKSTRAPLGLLGAAQFAGRRMLLLEPRRVAARAIAARLASSLGEAVGATVGYRIRQDTKVSAATRLEVITEGILTRMLQHDPELPGIGLIMFDEFHERSLHSDLALALTLDVQRNLRSDLQLLVMSATLDLPKLAALLAADDTTPAPVISTTATDYKVDVHWLGRPQRGERIETAMATAIIDAMHAPASVGDLLAFLPGAGEIERTRTLLAQRLTDNIVVAPLFGDLALADQERALAPPAPGQRKVVLATDIAQTSLTIPGVRIVVDSGLARVPSFDPQSGMTALTTVNVSRSSATQRAGRAGRVADGRCLRLWSAEQHDRLAAHDTPEILQSDLAPIVLELAAWGSPDPRALSWLDLPNEAAWAQARELLQRLHAVAGDGRITAHGRALAGLGAHPRLAHMLVTVAQRGRDRGHERAELQRAADIAALLEERDPLRREQFSAGVDIDARLQWLHAGSSGGSSSSGGDQGLRRRLRETATRHLRAAQSVQSAQSVQKRQRVQQSGAHPVQPEALDTGGMIALAYPDRIARKRDGGGGRYLMVNGRGAQIADDDALARQAWLAIAHLDGDARGAKVRLAAAVSESTVLALYKADLIDTRVTEWDNSAGSVQTHQTLELGAIRVRSRRLQRGDNDAVLPALLNALRNRGLHNLHWSAAGTQLRQRLHCLHFQQGLHGQQGPDAEQPDDWPKLDDDTLTATLEHWLGPWLTGASRLADVEQIDLTQALLGLLNHLQKQTLNRLLPTHIDVPSGSRLPIDYSDPHSPVLAVRIQEVFGWPATPMVLDGRLPLTLHLLSPAHRPMQVTRDLASFWRTGYLEVRRDLRSRYPRHSWPDDPRTATATKRAKPRGT